MVIHLKKFYKLLKPLLLFSISMIILLSSYSILLYFKILNPSSSTINTILLILGIISFLILGFFTRSLNGNGLLLGGIYALMIIVIFILTNTKINYLSYVKYLIYCLSSIIGAIIGKKTIKIK